MSRWGRERLASPSSPDSVETVRVLRTSLQKHFELAMNRIESYQKQSNAQQRPNTQFRVMHSGMYITGMRDVNLELSCSQLDGGSPYRFRSLREDEADKRQGQDREQEISAHGSPLEKFEGLWGQGQDAKQPLRASVMEKELESVGSDETEKAESPIKFGRINWPKFNDEVEKLLEEEERARGSAEKPLGNVEKDKETDSNLGSSFDIRCSVEEEDASDARLDEHERAQELDSPIKFGRINWPKTSEFNDEVEKKLEEEEVGSGSDSFGAEEPLGNVEKDKEIDSNLGSSFDIHGSVEEEEMSEVQLDERERNAESEEEEEAGEHLVSSDEGKQISGSEDSGKKDELAVLEQSGKVDEDPHSAEEKEIESPPPVVDLTSDGELSDVFPELTIDSEFEEEDISETVLPEIHICDDIDLPDCEGNLSPESSSHKDAVEELEAAIKSGESGRQKRAAEELANDTYLDEFDAFLSKIENEPLAKTNPQPVAEEYQSPILNQTSDFSSASAHEEERTELGVDLGSSDSVDASPREEQHAVSFYGNDNGIKLSDEDTPVVDQVMEISSSDSVTDLIQPTSVSPSSTLRAGAINPSESQGSVVLEAQEECLSQLATMDDDLNFVLLNEEEQNEQD